MYQRILVAMGEAEAINAQVVEEAAAIATAAKGILNLLHVLAPTTSSFPVAVSPTASGMHSAVTTEAFQLYLNECQTPQKLYQEILNQQSEVLLKQGVTAEWTLAVGDPGRQICTIAKNWQADLIFLGRHSRTSMEEFFLGSVSNYVMHHATCSVAVVPGKSVKELHVVS